MCILCKCFLRKRCGLRRRKATLLADAEGLSGRIHSIHFSAENIFCLFQWHKAHFLCCCNRTTAKSSVCYPQTAIFSSGNWKDKLNLHLKNSPLIDDCLKYPVCSVFKCCQRNSYRACAVFFFFLSL